jgi:hypothetical protein
LRLEVGGGGVGCGRASGQGSVPRKAAHASVDSRWKLVAVTCRQWKLEWKLVAQAWALIQRRK